MTYETKIDTKGGTPMATENKTATGSLTDRLARIADAIAANGKEADANCRFARENYAMLKEERIFSALVPAEYGGLGVSYAELCAFLSDLAGYHPSTALSLSMHSHIVAANRFNDKHGRPGRALLDKVVAKELALVSTGAGDWLASNGSMEKVDGGFKVSSTKHFASGSVAADVLVTSAPYEDPEAGWQVLHFPVPLSADGVTILDNWYPMGMRGTGSNSAQMTNVFVPDEAIAARRPRGDYHMMWSVILPVALPLIMSVYLGIARTAAERARARTASSPDPVTPYLLGEMENALTVAEMAVQGMIDIVGDFDFTPDLATVNEIVKRKTIAAEAVKQCTAKALEATGGIGFMEQGGIESLFRDAQASHFHPLQEKRQLLFTGSLAMGKEPPSQAF